MRKAVFKIETFVNKTFDGYTIDEDWNGWACPYFTFEEAQKIVESHKRTGQAAGFSKDSDSFYFNVLGEEEFYQSVDIDGNKLYPIGNSIWIWEEYF